ncbi:hypothetical protein HZS_3176 [Henneguya salminicola]|nr:hypothetical protein HZS_3176 [Henneguya salminicola]
MNEDWICILTEASGDLTNSSEHYETFICGSKKPITFGAYATYKKYYRILPFEIFNEKTDLDVLNNYARGKISFDFVEGMLCARFLFDGKNCTIKLRKSLNGYEIIRFLTDLLKKILSEDSKDKTAISIKEILKHKQIPFQQKFNCNFIILIKII